MSSATTCGNRSGPSRTPFRSWLKSVRLPPGILFAFIPESCSTSTRNAVRLHRGNLFALARNPHLLLKMEQRLRAKYSHLDSYFQNHQKLPTLGSLTTDSKISWNDFALLVMLTACRQASRGDVVS